MPIAGYAVGEPNYRLRFLVIVFFGVIMFGMVLFWREQAIYSQDYVEIPASAHLAKKSHSQATSQTNELRKELNNGQNQSGN